MEKSWLRYDGDPTQQQASPGWLAVADPDLQIRGDPVIQTLEIKGGVFVCGEGGGGGPTLARVVG